MFIFLYFVYAFLVLPLLITMSEFRNSGELYNSKKILSLYLGNVVLVGFLSPVLTVAIIFNSLKGLLVKLYGIVKGG